MMAVASVPSAMFGAAPGAPQQLLCEGLVNPLGIDRAQPRFSWAIPPGDRGLTQSAYQLLVADSLDALAADQGSCGIRARSHRSQSQWVSYAGAPLAKGSRCWWKVRVWDQTGTPSPWSEPASFSVGPLSAADWKGDWIGADWMKNHEGPLPWLRKTVTLQQVPTTATIYVCALGYYELYVNGRKVGDDVLSPAVSDYGKRGLYLTHDIAPYLVKGKNCIGLWLGRGWSLGVLKNAGNGGPMVKAELNITFDEGDPLTIVTDATWKARPSHITPLGKGTSGSYGGELVEAEKEIADWSAADYDDSDWRAATHSPSSHADHRRADDGAEPHAGRGPCWRRSSRWITGSCSTWAATTPAGSSWSCPTTSRGARRSPWSSPTSSWPTASSRPTASGASTWRGAAAASGSAIGSTTQRSGMRW